MKTIIVMRHSKTDEQSITGNDFDRKLRKKGIVAAKNASKKMQELGVAPDLILTSPAIRAKNTADIIAEQIELKDSILTKSYLYNRLYTFSEIIDDIISFNNESKIVLIVGHNPTLEYLCHQIHKQSNETLRTSSGVVFNFDTDKWNDVLNVESKRVCSFERED
ncbi:MAG: hypothetical protein AUK44_05820 [Porphyromonadaceae bacterium CG2_30_38_12]|nr:MAG: hypothetical protein AUK44_05820 [Porphyromonadaceae bacterium CG2_30_38_12]